MPSTVTRERPLPLEGFRTRVDFLERQPALAKHVTPSGLEWLLRVHREELAPYCRRRGNTVLIHDAAATVLASLLLRPY